MISAQIIINASEEKALQQNFDEKKSKLSGVIVAGDDALEITAHNLFEENHIADVVRVAIQGEPGLRFSFQTLVDPLDSDTYETIEEKIENACVTMSTVGIYEIDCSGFNLDLESLYVYLPKNKEELTKNVYIDVLYKTNEEGENN